MFKGKKFYLSVKKGKSKDLNYGNLIITDGEYIIPSVSRNYKGFDYREYLKTKKIYGTIKNSNKDIEIIKEKDLNILLIISNRIRNYIINTSDKLLPEKTSKLLTGILIGDKVGISEEIIQNFKISNLSHMLAVSGAHTSYIILGITYILNKSNISKKWIYIITILWIIAFMFITNFSVSVTRACFMAIIVLAANLLYRKQDFWTSISISVLITFSINPFSINEIGFELSYLGTIGIIVFNKHIENLLNRIKIKNKISKLLSVTISAQIMIMPVMILNFNTFSLTFFISNILASPFLGINIILGFITIFISLISFNLAKIISKLLNLSLETLIYISKFAAKLPLSNIIVKTPHIYAVILIYCFVLILNYIYSIYNSKENLRLFQKNIIKKISKYNLKKFLSVTIILIFSFNIFSYSYMLFPNNLRIYFIDVGQGDSCLIITPRNKKILIDGGEGKPKVLLSYLLDRRITTIDYLVISHFDSDHCDGLIEVIENIKVKNILISKQAYYCDEYINIANIINSKRINVINIKQGDKLALDKSVNINIMYPTKKLEYEDLNNNSIVAKLTYNKFSLLFTGDIENSEKNILSKYTSSELESNVIKIAHHGSKTSSSEEFIRTVNPKIALIGVGEDNKFGHPNEEVIERLENINCKILRTDTMGEIFMEVTDKGKVKIDTRLSATKNSCK